MAKKKTTLNDLNDYLKDSSAQQGHQNPSGGQENKSEPSSGQARQAAADGSGQAKNNTGSKKQTGQQKDYLKQDPHKLVEEEKVDPEKAGQAKQLTEEQLLEQVEQLAKQNGEETEVVLTRLFHSHLKKNFEDRYSNLPTPAMDELVNLQFSMLNMGLQYGNYVQDIAEHWFGLAGQYGFMPYLKDVFSRN